MNDDDLSRVFEMVRAFVARRYPSQYPVSISIKLSGGGEFVAPVPSPGMSPQILAAFRGDTEIRTSGQFPVVGPIKPSITGPDQEDADGKPPVLLVCSPDYRSVRFQGELFLFTPYQAAVVQQLHEVSMTGTPEVGQNWLLNEIGSACKKLHDLFKNRDGTHPAWGTLIVPGTRAGAYRLARPDENLSDPDAA